MRGMWQLLWTTKAEREIRKSIFPPCPQRPKDLPNGYGYGSDERLGQFHSQVAIDPINNKSYLELDDQRKSAP